MIYGFATTLVTWKRATAYVLDSVAVASSHAGDRAPVMESQIQVLLSGSPTGTVTVSGTVDGTPAQTEVLTWSGASGYRATRKRFTGALTFTLSQSGATTIEAKAIGTGGEPALALYTVKAGIPVTMEEPSEGNSPARMEGDQAEAWHRFLVGYEETWTPRRGDRIVDDRTGDVYEVRRVEEKAGGLYVSQWAVKAYRLDSKGS